MGQYFLAIILSEEGNFISAYLDPSNYNSGLKLTEHSYIDNDFMNVFEKLISPNGYFYKSKIVWAGDYAEAENNVVLNSINKVSDFNKTTTDNYNLYNIAHQNRTLNIIPVDYDMNGYRYIINHSKKVYVDKKNIDENADLDNLYHPLPILTAEGNGVSGSDYYGNNSQLCGTWARDIISANNIIPNEYKELVCDFY
jgi:hypothetical protein